MDPDHNYIGHNYVGHNHIGHNYIGHNFIGYDYCSVWAAMETNGSAAVALDRSIRCAHVTATARAQICLRQLFSACRQHTPGG